MTLALAIACVLALFVFRGEGGWNAYWDVSPDGSRVAYASEDVIWEKDLKSGRTQSVGQGVAPVVVGGTDVLAFCGSDDGIWVQKESEPAQQILAAEGGVSYRQLAYDSQTRRLFTAGLSEPGAGGRFHSWDLFSCKLDGSDLVRQTNAGFWMLRMSSKPFADHRLWFTALGPATDTNLNQSLQQIGAMDLTPPFRTNYLPAPEESDGPAFTPYGTRYAVVAHHPGEHLVEEYDTVSSRRLSVSRESGLLHEPLYVSPGNRLARLKDGGNNLTASYVDSPQSRPLFVQGRKSRSD